MVPDTTVHFSTQMQRVNTVHVHTHARTSAHRTAAVSLTTSGAGLQWKTADLPMATRLWIKLTGQHSDLSRCCSVSTVSYIHRVEGG